MKNSQIIVGVQPEAVLAFDYLERVYSHLSYDQANSLLFQSYSDIAPKDSQTLRKIFERFKIKQLIGTQGAGFSGGSAWELPLLSQKGFEQTRNFEQLGVQPAELFLQLPKKDQVTRQHEDTSSEQQIYNELV